MKGQSLLGLSVALSACVFTAQADTYRIKGQDRAGTPREGTVEVTQTSTAGGDLVRRVAVILGELRLEGSLNEAGELALDAGTSAASPKAPFVGVGPILEGREASGSAPASSAPSPASSTPSVKEPAGGRVQIQGERLRLDLRDAEGKPLFRAGGALVPAGDPDGAAPERRERQAAAAALEAAEARVAEAAQRLAAGEDEQRDDEELRYLEASERSGGHDATPASPSAAQQAAWQALREDYAQAATARDALQKRARLRALTARDLGAAKALRAANARRLAEANRALEASRVTRPALLAEQARLQANLRAAQKTVRLLLRSPANELARLTKGGRNQAGEADAGLSTKR